MTRLHLALAGALLTLAACHPGPVIGGGGMPNVGGTIAGIVSTDGNAPVVGRKVTVIETTSGARFDATTGANGGDKNKIPPSPHRHRGEAHRSERGAKKP